MGDVSRRSRILWAMRQLLGPAARRRYIVGGPAVLAGALCVPVLAGPAAAAPVQCAPAPSQKVVARCLQQATPALDAAYAAMARQAGVSWAAPRVVTFGRKPPANPCQDLEAGGVMSSFYCPDNKTVYMMLGIAADSTQLYAEQAGPKILRADARRVGVSVKTLRKGFAAAAQVNVLSHEMAHQLLFATGIDGWYARRADKYSTGGSKYDRNAFVVETMADCLSGATQRVAKEQGTLRMNAFDRWAAQADYAGADPFDDVRPLRAPFVYPNVWGKRVYRGYGGPYIRLQAWNAGWAAGAQPNPLQVCVTWAAGMKRVPTPPLSQAAGVN